MQHAEHRERIIEQLSSQFANDAMEVEELDHRLALAHAAETPAALDALVMDLGANLALVPTRKLRVVLGSTERRGTWTLPSPLHARVVCGNLLLDLRDAHLPSGPLRLEVHVTMGNLEVLLPPGVAVDLDVGATLGNVEDQTQPGFATRTLTITGRVVLGNVEVATGRGA